MYAAEELWCLSSSCDTHLDSMGMRHTSNEASSGLWESELFADPKTTHMSTCLTCWQVHQQKTRTASEQDMSGATCITGTWTLWESIFWSASPFNRLRSRTRSGPLHEYATFEAPGLSICRLLPQKNARTRSPNSFGAQDGASPEEPSTCGCPPHHFHVAYNGPTR